jgi:hypothetical protein
MSTLKVNAIQNTSGVEQYLAKAWVNFNGTGTVAIRASGNVSSITDNGTGDYTVNFTTAMADADYSVSGSAGLVAMAGTLITSRVLSVGLFAASNFRISSYASTSGTMTDFDLINVTIFR